jgi:hypothetical protein
MEALTIAARVAHDVITTPPSANQNVTEWAKQQACWDRIASKDVEWPDAWLGELLSAGQQKRREQSAQKDQKELDGIEAQTIVVKAGGRAWRDARAWGLEHSLLSPSDDGILSVCGRVPEQVPTDRQCLRAVKVLQRLRQEGYTGGPAV